MKKFMTKKNLLILAAVAMVALPLAAFAVTAPTSTDSFYDIYDIVVNKFLKGPVGFVAAVVAIIAGFSLAFQQKFIPGVVSVALGVVMIKADSLVTSMGALF